VIFEPHDHSLAEFVVPPTGATGFGARTLGVDAHVHDIVVGGSPRWRLTMPLGDDDWELETFGPTADSVVPEEVELRYLEWAEGTCAENGFSALAALPTGRYYVVRSELIPSHGASARIGNGSVARPENVLTLLESHDRTALAVGATPGKPPDLAQPLIGTALLHYSVSGNDNGVLFFAPAQPTVPTTGDLVLVLPVAGELVLDTRWRWTDQRPTEAELTWSRSGALEFAKILKGSPPSRRAKIS